MNIGCARMLEFSPAGGVSQLLLPVVRLKMQTLFT
jgi:hypothetical protein